MNKIISRITRCTLFAACALSIASCQQNKFHVSGNITDAKDSVLYFENMSLDGPVVLDSVKLGEDGAFDFSGDAVTAPEFFRLRIASNIINVSIDSTETVEFTASYVYQSESDSYVEKKVIGKYKYIGGESTIDLVKDKIYYRIEPSNEFRIVDDSGEDYLYNPDSFEKVE